MMQPLALVRSGLVGVWPLEGGRHILWHVLGRTLAIADDDVLEAVRRFEVPLAASDFVATSGMEVDGAERLVQALREALVLRLSQHDEAEWIRFKYKERLAALPSIPWRRRRASTSAREPLPKSLVLAKAIVSIDLDDDEVLVTHPLGPPLHLTRRAFNVARTFRDPREPGGEDGGALLAFLVRQRLLWPSHAEEERAIREQFNPEAEVSLAIRAGNPWGTKYRAFDIDVPDLEDEYSVALVGGCQLLAASEALRYVAAREGVHLTVDTLLPDATLDRAYDLVVYAPVQFGARMYESAAAGNMAEASARAREVLALLDEALSKLRASTSCPIAVLSFAPPGLWHAPLAIREAFDTILASLNLSIAHLPALATGGALIDERRLPESVGFRGAYWDDEFNAIPHHAPISNWSFVDLPADEADAHLTREGLAALEPAFLTGQMDPNAALALQIWRQILATVEKEPVSGIVFEPNGLLWPGSLDERDAPYPDGGPHFYTADHHYVYAGIHEALVALRRRGIKLLVQSRTPREQLLSKWRFDSPMKNLVRLTDVDAIADTALHVPKVAETVGVREENLLALSPLGDGFRGRVFTGSPLELRRYLLTSPALAHTLGRIEGRSDDSAASAQARRAVDDGGSDAARPELLDDLESQVDEVLCGKLNCSPAVLARMPNLQLLGLDSLHALDVVNLIQERLGVKFPDSALIASVVFSRDGLVREARRALLEAGSARSDGSRATVDEEALEVRRTPRDVWSARSVGTVIRDNIEAARTPWAFKFLRSSARNDYEYLTWRGLDALADRYAELYSASGASELGTVLLLLPTGAGLVGAVVGAIYANVLPAVCAYPNPKLSADAFRSWFGAIVSKSEAKLIVCEAEVAGVVAEEIERAGLAVKVVSEVPRGSRTLPRRLGGGVDAPVLVQHSSGTTGLKKAVKLTHGGLLAQVWDLAEALDAGPNDKIVSWLPLYHDMGFIACLLFPLLCGVPTVMMSPFDWVQKPDLLFRQISDERGTFCWLPNFAFAHSARRTSESALTGCDLTSLRAVINCSEPLTSDAFVSFFERFAKFGLRYSALSSSYAMAEATFAVTQSRPGAPARRLRVLRQPFYAGGKVVPATADVAEEDTVTLVSSGSPVGGARVDILGEAGSPVPDGNVGEVRVRGDSVVKGYFGDIEASSAMQGDAFLTGDIGFVWLGEVYVTGRKKDLIIQSGHNLYPHEIESLVSTVPGIRPGRVVAFGVFEAREGTERLVVLAEREGNERSDEDIVADVRGRVSGLFATVVSDIRLLSQRELLKSTSGKLSRSANRDLYLSSVASEAKS